MKSYDMTIAKLDATMAFCVRAAITNAVEQAELEYADTYRLMEIGDQEAEQAFLEEEHEGCCGRFETELEVGERKFRFGCRYGH